MKVVVIGGGIGGLSAASRLAARGVEVTLLEAAPFFGGLAAGFEADGLAFDGGPYILLDRPGLEWAFSNLGLELASELRLRRVDFVYEVRSDDAPPVQMYSELDETAAALEVNYPGSDRLYRRFVAEMTLANERLRPLLTHRSPGALSALRTGAFRALPVLLRGLGSVLEATGLPRPVQHALAIWTHIAGQELASAPSPLAFVPALIHGQGSWVPEGGVAAVARRLEALARTRAVNLRANAEVSRIVVEEGRAVGVVLRSGEELRADAVVSNAGGVGTLLDLLPQGSSGIEEWVGSLPLQSPGVAAFLAARPTAGRAPYMTFFRADDPEAPSRLLVQPSALSGASGEGRVAARFVAPLAHSISTALEASGQDALLQRLLATDPLLRELGSFEVVARRTPRTYGALHHLHRDSMNPVMTAAFMRKGRLPHRLPKPRGLYLVGSATHPGQWVSFCAISGVLGANDVLADLGLPAESGSR